MLKKKAKQLYDAALEVHKHGDWLLGFTLACIHDIPLDSIGDPWCCASHLCSILETTTEQLAIAYERARILAETMTAARVDWNDMEASKETAIALYPILFGGHVPIL